GRCPAFVCLALLAWAALEPGQGICLIDLDLGLKPGYGYCLNDLLSKVAIALINAIFISASLLQPVFIGLYGYACCLCRYVRIATCKDSLADVLLNRISEIMP